MSSLVKENKSTGFDLSMLSSTRAQLFGIATLMVVIFHSYISFKTLLPDAAWLATTLDTIRRCCVVGVDMFLFMSGIGLYYSLSGKNKSLKDYYKKRATRILPALFVVAVIWFGIRGAETGADYLKDVFLISFWQSGKRIFWYFALIIVLYAIYPLIHLMIEKIGPVAVVILITASVLGTVLLKEFNYRYFQLLEIALTRIPIFLLGAGAGKFVKEGKKLNTAFVVLSAALIIPLIVLGYHFIPDWMEMFESNKGNLLWLQRGVGSMLGLCITISFAALFSKVKPGAFSTFLVWFGSMSMELYLVHEKLGILLKDTIKPGDPSRFLYYSITVVIALLLAMALKAMENSLDKNLFYRKKQEKK